MIVRELIERLAQFSEMDEEVVVSGSPFFGSEEPMIKIQKIEASGLRTSEVVIMIDFEPHNLDLKTLDLVERED